MALDECMVSDTVGIDNGVYGDDDDKLLTVEEDDGCGDGNVNKCVVFSNSLSANAFRIRSVNGDTYIGHRL